MFTMDKETYKKMTGFLHSHPKQAKTVVATNKAITYAIYLAYPCLLLWLTFHNGASALLEGRIDPLLPRAILVPAISFIAGSIFRILFNAPRPYEVFDLPPVIAKNTKGKSFPSRHAFSIFIIGMTFLASCPLPLAGWFILALGVCLALVRVLAGVHFPRDVIAGALLGIAFGYFGFWVI